MMLGSHRVRDARRIAICLRDKLTCRYCGNPVDSSGHIDHVHPRKHGGMRDTNNLVLSCASCNSSKQDTPVYEWHGREIEAGLITQDIWAVARVIAREAKRNKQVRDTLIRKYIGT